jgi:ABC-type siderophore export system fused ATPase/permease subunit
MSNPATTQMLYRERVTPKWTNFLPLALIFPTFWLTFAPINAAAGLISGVVVTLLVFAFMFLNSPIIEIKPGQIRVSKARIEAKYLGKVEIAPPAPRFAQRVPNLDARAYLALQNSQKGLIKLEISDSKDPTPYWVFSTKNPDAVIQALLDAKKSRK